MVRNIRYENIYKRLLDGWCNSSSFSDLPSSLLLLPTSLALPLSEMAHFEVSYDRQFHVDPVTAQTFFREHVNGIWGMWRPLEPSDFHPPRPAAHNVGSHGPSLVFVANPSHLYSRCFRATYLSPRQLLLIPPFNSLSLLPLPSQPRVSQPGIWIRILLSLCRSLHLRAKEM